MTLPALLPLCIGMAWAQLNITAEVDKTTVALDDQVVLSVVVTAPQAMLPEPQLPPLSNFSVYSSGRSQNVSIINGQVSSSIVHTYVMVPRFVGRATVGPISIAAQGRKAQTEPIEITVERPGSASRGAAGRARREEPAAEEERPRRAGAPEAFVTAEVDKKKAYVNEQATLSIKFYTAVSLLGNPQYSAPKMSGFISEDLPPERHGTVTLHGRPYYFSEIKTALFPAQPGKLAIGPATVACQIQSDASVDPFTADFFERFFSQGAAAPQTRELKSDPLVLEAQPLPEVGKPANFSGAVGRFSISAALDRPQAKAGEAVTLTVTVEGSGNLKSIGEPEMPSLEAFRVYDTVSSLNMDKRKDLVRGSKVFKTVIMPKTPGSFTVPPIALSYFDPEKKAYLRASTLPLAIKVEEGAPSPADRSESDFGPRPEPRGLTVVSRDIRYLKLAPSRSALSRLLEAAAAAGPIHSLPFLLLGLCAAWDGWRRRRLADPQAWRERAALKKALSRIKQAQAAADPQKSAALLAEALSRYLADKLGRPYSGLTWRRARESLLERHPRLPKALLEKTGSVWEDLDHVRFAPPSAGAGPSSLMAESLSWILKELDKELA
ncbi:MAG: protein BatD [Elusimicrobia bacterium]|nr:protein BatD [Elusimicrobiota bacterium]